MTEEFTCKYCQRKLFSVWRNTGYCAVCSTQGRPEIEELEQTIAFLSQEKEKVEALLSQVLSTNAEVKSGLLAALDKLRQTLNQKDSRISDLEYLLSQAEKFCRYGTRYDQDRGLIVSGEELSLRIMKTLEEK